MRIFFGKGHFLMYLHVLAAMLIEDEDSLKTWIMKEVASL